MPMSVDTFACSEIRASDEICDIIKKPERPVYIFNLIHFMVLSALIQHTNSQTAYDLRWLWIGQIEEVDHQVVDFPTLENIRNVPQCCWCDMPSTSFENCKKVRYKVNGNVSYVSYKNNVGANFWSDMGLFIGCCTFHNKLYNLRKVPLLKCLKLHG